MKAPWIIVSIIFAVVIIWLVFKPSSGPDNSKAQNTIDSLTKVNQGLRNALTVTISTVQPKIDSLTRASDSLGTLGAILSDKLDASETEKLRLARLILKKDTLKTDLSCIDLAKKVIIDSGIIVQYQATTDNIIRNLGQIIEDKDSVILSQHSLILSDSVLISAHAALDKTQNAEIAKLVKKGKFNAWAVRTLAVVGAVLAVIVVVK